MAIMTDREIFTARTQRHITMLLIYSLIVLIVGLIVAAFLPLKANQEVLSLATPLITGLYGLASGAVGFWIATMRQKTPPDQTTVTQEHTSPDGSVMKIISPANAPAGAVPTLTTSRTLNTGASTGSATDTTAAPVAPLAYDATAVYPVNARVTYAGAEYISILPVLAGVLPTNTAFWTPVVAPAVS